MRSILIFLVAMQVWGAASPARAQSPEPEAPPPPPTAPAQPAGATAQGTPQPTSAPPPPASAAPSSAAKTTKKDDEPACKPPKAKRPELDDGCTASTSCETNELAKCEAGDDECTVQAYKKCSALCPHHAFDTEWHHAQVGVLGHVAGAMRGYNQHSAQLVGQLGLAYVAFETAIGVSGVKIQTLPSDHDAELGYAFDARAIFYGNGRRRAGFFVGGGTTFVNRDKIHIACDDQITACPGNAVPGDVVRARDPRIEWWIRAPIGIDVSFAVLPDSPATTLFGRAIIEPWIPVGALDDEVTVMFGIGLGVMFGARNDHVAFAK